MAKEFPTAPTDSFLVANADYVAKATGSDAVGTFLVQTDGTSPATVAQRVRAQVGTSAQVTDIVNQRKVVGSNLTAVELSGLTKVELGFALVLAAAATGPRARPRLPGAPAHVRHRQRARGARRPARRLRLERVGVRHRRRAGARRRIAGGISDMLVKVLTGVFDPPPDFLSIPWGYLGSVVALVCVAVLAAGALTLRALRRPAIEELKP